MSNVERYKAEEQRQTQLLCDAIQAAINASGLALREQGAAPILNAVFGALATNLAHALCAIETRRDRKMMRDMFDRAVARAIADPKINSAKKSATFVVRERSGMQ